MNESLNFFTYWKKSLIAHCFVFLFLILGSKFQWLNFLDYQTQLIHPSVRVDIVELPKYTLEELKKLEIAPPPKKEETVKPEEKVEQKVEQKVKNDDSRFEEIFKKIEKNVNKKRKENEKLESRRNEMREVLLAGNKLQSGSVTQGDEQKQDVSIFEQYILEVTDKVRINWKLPTYLQQSSLKCRIQLFINSQGGLELTKIIESSGNSEFDAWALKAVEETLPFKLPDPQIVPQLLRGKFVLGFPL